VNQIIDADAIHGALAEHAAPSAGRVREILAKARELDGLAYEEVATLLACTRRDLDEEIFHAAREAKEAIYGNRLVLFAPLYITNKCQNDCLYCAFRVSNRGLARRDLTFAEIADETRMIIREGHKRILMVAGEHYPDGQGLDYVFKAIETVYAVKEGHGEIRRLNVNVAALTVEQCRQLKACRIGTYQLFQETYHRGTYASVHLAGRKKDYDWRVTAMDRAMEAGIDDVGIGVLFGLFDWRYELLALMQHIRHLEARHGVGPHTLSVPRLEPATGSDLAAHPPHAVSDIDFRKIVAILRLAVPYTGIIMSTRESADIRRETFALGVSQISAGSRTNPGGYADSERENASQFCLGDHRPLDEVIRDVAALGYIPSFCTACYRLGRTGQDFMDLAKPGEIKEHCDPNALATFVEYLIDYGSAETRAVGEPLVDRMLETLGPVPRQMAASMVARVRAGKRDVFC
jgi:2-iminoacetate synthase